MAVAEQEQGGDALHTETGGRRRAVVDVHLDQLHPPAEPGRHVLERRGGLAASGPVTAVRMVATGVFVTLAWLPISLTQIADLGAVYLRLFGLR